MDHLSGEPARAGGQPRRSLRAGLRVAVLLVTLALGALPAFARGTGTAKQADPLAAYANAEADWGHGVEGVIENAYRRCFRTFLVDGRFVTLRMPFGENNERSELVDGDLPVVGGGKADPDLLWRRIGRLIAGSDFASYLATLSDGVEKVVTFDIEGGSWSTSREWFYIDRMHRNAYPGLPHRPFVLTAGTGATLPDIYNYVYCMGRYGMDCSGFVWYTLKSVARTNGVNLDRILLKASGAPGLGKAPLYIGTWFFDPSNPALEEVKDEIRNLQPADIILFRSEDGGFIHSGIIQSIDRKAGTIRYLQSTDEAPQAERGVHESFISFNPARQEASLKDPSVLWRQVREPTFAGEPALPFGDDGSRYRAYPDRGGGTVVRLKALKKTIEKLRAGR